MSAYELERACNWEVTTPDEMLFDRADSAMCIWEDVLTFRDHEGNASRYDWLISGEGAATGRANAWNLSLHMHRAWLCACKEGFDDSFDWEFVPAVMSVLVDAFETPEEVTVHDVIAAWKIAFREEGE